MQSKNGKQLLFYKFINL